MDNKILSILVLSCFLLMLNFVTLFYYIYSEKKYRKELLVGLKQIKSDNSIFPKVYKEYKIKFGNREDYYYDFGELHPVKIQKEGKTLIVHYGNKNKVYSNYDYYKVNNKGEGDLDINRMVDYYKQEIE